MAYQITEIPMTLSDFNNIRQLRAILNRIFGTVGKQLTRL